jgi:hypothetical protein
MNWSIKNIIRACLLALPLAALTTVLVSTFVPPRQEQDDCSFGAVTNAEYRTMLSTARSLRWKSIFAHEKLEDALLAQFVRVSGNNPSPYVKVASMHAVLRAWGGDFRNINERQFGKQADQYEKASHEGGGVSFNYAVTVPQIGLTSLPGQAWFIGHLNGPLASTAAYDRKKYRQGRFYFVAWRPNPIDPIPSDVFRPGDSSCPPVPAENLANFFSGKPDEALAN